MEHPYDRPDMESSLAATLAVLRERPLAPRPNAEMLAAAEQVAAPLAAFAHTLGSYLPGPDFGDLETDAELTENDLDDWVADLRSVGCDLGNCLRIGTNGGGEEFLFMAADPGAAGYVLVLWSMDGDPYKATGSPVWRVGTFADLFRFLGDRGELDPRLAAVAG